MHRNKAVLGLVLLALLGLLITCDNSSDRANLAGTGEIKVTEACVLPEDDVVVRATSSNVEFVRTPEECFTGLVEFEYTPNYAEIDGLRMHYVDEGPSDGEVVLMLHGQPSWSYLYRKMIPILVDAGYRVIALDHIGMGRSDKPVDPRVHQFEQHVSWIKEFITRQELQNITLFVQDWGSVIGLRIAGDLPDLFARIVLANGDLPIIPEGANPFTVPVFEIDESLGSAQEFFENRSRDRIEGFQQWIDYAASAPDLVAGDVVEIGTLVTLSDTQHAAYSAPFPSLIYKAAIRAFPSMIAGIEEQNRPAWEVLGSFQKPFLALAGEFDPNLGSEQIQNKWIDHVPGTYRQDHKRYEASHFIQEDVGTELAAQVVAFMQQNPSGRMFSYSVITSASGLGVDLLDDLRTSVLPTLEDAGAQVYAIWGQAAESSDNFVEIAEDKVVVMLRWRSVDTQLLAAELESLPGASHVETSLFEVSLRAVGNAVSTGPGFYIHRFTRYNSEDVDEVLSLSEQAWVTWEPTFEAEVIGVWRDLSESDGLTSLLRIAWYRDLAHWPETRDITRVPDALPFFIQRAKLQVDIEGWSASLIER